MEESNQIKAMTVSREGSRLEESRAGQTVV